MYEEQKAVIKNYALFFVNGSIINLVCLLVRHLVGTGDRQTDFAYVLTIGLIYLFAFGISYASQSALIFRKQSAYPHSASRILRFIVINVCAVILTASTAALLRDQVLLVHIFGRFVDDAAMAIAAMMVSFASFYCTSRFVYGNAERAATT